MIFSFLQIPLEASPEEKGGGENEDSLNVCQALWCLHNITGYISHYNPVSDQIISSVEGIEK